MDRVRMMRNNELDDRTAQTLGMHRAREVPELVRWVDDLHK
jgi:hypothetical protein